MCGFVVSIGDVNKSETINATNSIKYRVLMKQISILMKAKKYM